MTRISDIRSLSIYPTREMTICEPSGAPAYVQVVGSYTLYGISIQTERNYRLRWELNVAECKSLVNEIQSWLDSVR